MWAVNPLVRIEHEPGGAGARGRGRFQGRVAVLEFAQGVHGQSGARDVATLGFERGEGGGFHRRSGEY